MEDVTKDLLDNILNSETVNFTTPTTVRNVELYQFQKKAIAYLFHSKRAILGDPVGSGKTLVCIGLFSLLKQLGQTPKVLVIAPASIIFQWRFEIEHYSTFKALVVKGTKDKRMTLWNDAKNFDFVVTNYETLKNDLEEVVKFDWGLQIFDEATHFKNRDTGVAKAIRDLTKLAHSDRVLALTATPLQNSLMELFSILEPIDPEILGNFYIFKNRYCIEKLFEIYRRGRTYRFKKIVGYRYPLEVREKIRYNFIGRPKSEILSELPPLVHQYRWLTLTPNQKKAYDEVIGGVLKKGKKMKKVELAQKLVYALEICDSLALINPKKKDSSKLEEIKNLLTGELQGQKVVIFSFYKKMIAEIEKLCEKLELNPLRITGDEGKEEREDNKQKFIKEDKYKVLLGTSAIEEGLNLQQVGYMVVVDRMYNPQRMKQLYGRLHRIGQLHSQVTIIHLIVKDTIEEKVLKILETKEKLFQDVFQSEPNKDLLMSMKDEEIDELLKGEKGSAKAKKQHQKDKV